MEAVEREKNVLALLTESSKKPPEEVELPVEELLTRLLNRVGGNPEYMPFREQLVNMQKLHHADTARVAEAEKLQAEQTEAQKMQQHMQAEQQAKQAEQQTAQAEKERLAK